MGVSLKPDSINNMLPLTATLSLIKFHGGIEMISKLLNMLTKKTTTQQTTVAIEKNMDYYI